MVLKVGLMFDRLPDAPDMEIYCLYGTGIPTDRSYVFKLSPSDKCKKIPLRIDTSVNGEKDSCLKNRVSFMDVDHMLTSWEIMLSHVENLCAMLIVIFFSVLNH